MTAARPRSCKAARTLVPTATTEPGVLEDPAAVSSLRLDRYEITVGRFRAFVEAYPESRPAPGAGAHPLIEGSGWDPAWDPSLAGTQAALRQAVQCDPDGTYYFQSWAEEAGPKDDLPMSCLSWFEAFAFCAWDGARLPTEAERGYAAAGGGEQRYFPWSVPPTSLAVDPSYDVYFCQGDGSAPQMCSPADILPVGTGSPMGDGRWGQANLGGSVEEWVFDWSYVYPDPCDDCANLLVDPTNPGRRLRGGDFP